MRPWIALLAVASARAFSPLVHRQGPNPPPPFDWYALSPSDNITWFPCFGGQLCARLNLPLDYASPSGPMIQVALQMIPATDKASYRGTVIVNPGGPGGAGTQFILGNGPSLAALFGPSFDVLVFDPRGTGATTPLARCFASPEESDAWHLSDVKILRLHDDSIREARSRDQTLSAVCESALGGNGKEEPAASAEDWGIGRFMDSASVATDMLRIVEKLGQDKLQYYGLSYGTLLGQYFAAMYPDKVGRMVLDGVVDGVSWQNGTYFDSIRDADGVMDAFYANCAKAGASKCAIWEKSAAAVSRRLDLILSAVRRDPLPLPSGSVVTEDAALGLFFNSLYTPLTGFARIANAARALETRDAAFWSQIPLFQSDVGLPPWFQSTEALQAVSCSDYAPLSDSLAAEIATVRNATRLSRWAGPIMSRLRITCGAWRIRAKARFTGPVSARLDVPVLVLSSAVDPVTPLSAARTVVSRFQGMRLLEQNSVGHTALLSLSTCTAKAVGKYLLEGTLPAEGAVCQPDVIPLVDDVQSSDSEGSALRFVH